MDTKLTPDALADKCESWLQAGGASNIVDAYEAGYREAELTFIKKLAASDEDANERFARWLWTQLMEWCSKRGVSPSEHAALFAIVERARKRP